MIDILVDDITPEGMRRLKLVSDRVIDAEVTLPIVPPSHAEVRAWSDDGLGLHYLEAVWMCREAVGLQCEGWGRKKGVVVWKLAAGERVSVALHPAMALFGETFKCFPVYAFMRKLPSVIENWFEVAGVEFHQADWVPAGCLVLSDGL